MSNKSQSQNPAPVVTRFAPSPTGYIHIGNVRSAIYPYLIARQAGGRFILRIEDTDQTRYVPGATELIEETLRWLGLDWDEGVEVGGPHGPYFQSERRDIYAAWAKKLIAAGRAYADPTPPETIQQYREQCAAAKTPFLYRNFRPATDTEWQPGIPLRFKTEPRGYSWHDEVMGDLSTGPEVLDDIILIKKDGLPTYNFAHIVDDAEMEVTHIVRGVEYLSSMPNYLAIYEALGLPRPKFVSLPHVLAPTGNKKLSKRDGAKSATGYRDDGVLPEAMLNYLTCLGWNDGSEKEIYTMDELIQSFSIDRIQNSGARFDETKLLWTNGQWIRKIATGQGSSPTTDTNAPATPDGLAALYERCSSFWPEAASTYSDAYRLQVLAIIYDRLRVLGDLRDMTSYFFADPPVDLALLTGNKFLKKMSETELISLLTLTMEKLSALPESDWTADNLQTVLNTLLAESGKKPAELFSLIRISVSFAPFSPALHLTLAVLGKSVTMARLSAVKTAISSD